MFCVVSIANVWCHGLVGKGFVFITNIKYSHNVWQVSITIVLNAILASSYLDSLSLRSPFSYTIPVHNFQAIVALWYIKMSHLFKHLMKELSYIDPEL